MTKAVQVSVLTEDDVAVKDVEVTFDIRAGAGGFLAEDGSRVSTLMVKTNNRGIARVRFVFDEHTDTAPYYTLSYSITSSGLTDGFHGGE